MAGPGRTIPQYSSDQRDVFYPTNVQMTAESVGRIRNSSLPMQQIVSNVDQYGNTSAASIPLALRDGIMRGQVKPPATCALVGFGGGLTWGAAIVRWTAEDQRK